MDQAVLEALRLLWPAAAIDGVGSGRQTLERVVRFPYRALILDHRILEPAACEVLRRIRSMGLELPVVYCLTPAELRKRPRKGAQAVLLHPVTAAHVVEALAGLGVAVPRVAAAPATRNPEPAASPPARPRGHTASVVAASSGSRPGGAGKVAARKPMNADEKTKQAVAKLWERFQGATLQRVTVLEQTAAELQGGILPSALRRQAEREAHKLAGAVGTFGFLSASQWAREVEQMLQGEGALGAAAAQRLAALVAQLRQELGAPPQAPGPAVLAARPEENPGPLLLIVADDAALAERLETEARHGGWRATWVAHPDAARGRIADRRPDAVLLDLDFPATCAAAWSLLRELGTWQPPLPVLVLTDRGSFTDRVEAVKLGGHGFLPKSLAAVEIVAAVREAWERLQGTSATVLALDDDPQVLRLLEVLLKAENLRLTTLQDAGRFWQVLGEVRPDLIMLDVDMPQVNGIELCRVLRQDAQWCELPVLFLTAHTDAAVVDQLYAAGADDYLSKPIIGTELVNRLRNRLERSRLLRSLAETDPLTGLMNRRKAVAAVEQFVQLAQRRQQPIALALLDVDHFKQVNDQHGHVTGDQVLARLSELLRRAFRGEDVVARWGGEEFLVALYGMTRGDGVQRLAELLEQVRGERFGTAEGRDFAISFSAGLAQFPDDGGAFTPLYRAADQALQLSLIHI